MDTNIEIRKYHPEDAPILNEMVTRIYGFTQDVRIWKWKYEDNPLKKNYSYVAVANGRIIAHIGGLVSELQIGGEKFVGSQLSDLMADPEHRVKGAFTMAFLTQTQTVVEDGHCPFGFANPNSAAATVKTGMNMLGPMVPRLDRVVDFEPVIRRKVKTMLVSRPLGFLVNSAAKLLYTTRAPRLADTQSIEEIESFDERFDELWERVGADFPRTLARSSAYLEWRYRKHPTQDYKVFAFADKGDLKGFIVLRAKKDEDITRGLVIDLVTDLRQPEVWEALLIKGMEYLVKEGADLITCWMFDHMPYHGTLKKLRFIDRPSDLNVNIYGEQGKHDVETLNDPKNWYVSMGDTDVW